MQPSRSDLLRIATANQQLIESLKELYYALDKSSDPDIPQRVHAYIDAVLGLTERISKAVAPPDSDLLAVASTNQQIIAQTQELYYRLSSSSDRTFASLGLSYISRVLDLTGQISAAISGL